MLEKTYNAKACEARLYPQWEDAGAFKPRVDESGESYCIVIPPPNVTGSLHMGHALNNTLQDILVRFERMRGKDVLWQPGTDHAGIATQMVVERQLAESGTNQTRREMGRDAFIEKVWDWKAESGGIIVNQLKRLGASCDWSRERFTMDEGLSRAVLKVFVDLYKKGLIYRGKRLVNWDPKFQTAISDLEVENVEVDGHMWHFKYPLAANPETGERETYEYVERDEDGIVTLRETRDYISIATTRPETMLGDGAVAVHPGDERYAPIVGKFCEIPVGPKEYRRLIPIITDEYPDPDFGSGAVKITGAHDFNDYAVAKRNNIPLYRLMDEHAAMRADGTPYAEAAASAEAVRDADSQPDEAHVDSINIVPDKYRGLDRFEARKRVVAEIDAEGLMIMVEDKKVMQPFGDRSKVVIEPMLTDQWFCDAETLAKPAIEAVENGETVFVPKAWEKTYFDWMRNIQPWCISRQLWWGHQIPAWYGTNGAIHVAHDEAEAQAMAGEGVTLTRDPDVLDTWFSSALWPFSTLGWPDDTAELKRFYQTDVLVTGFDIIFFWVARMMMMGMEFMKDGEGTPEVPFHTVYIHALVRDEKGQKMSKSKGNVIDPLELIDAYGADALRFTLAAMAAQGRDIKLARSRVEGYRNFTTKLWNAARFCEMNECVRVDGYNPANVEQTVNRWIVGEAEDAAKAVTAAIEAYRFNDAAGALYRFIWNVFCDWYLELAKPVLTGDNAEAKAETRATAAWTLDQILALLHPFQPFVTEELWERTGETGPARDTMLVQAAWPVLDGMVDETAAADINWLIDLVTAIRSVRAEMNVPPGAQVPLALVAPDGATTDRAARYDALLSRLARLSSIETVDVAPAGAIQVVVGETVVALSVADVIDISGERQRLSKDMEKLDKEIGGFEKKLGNAQFMERAPDHVIEEQRERKADAEARREKLKGALARLEGAA